MYLLTFVTLIIGILGLYSQVLAVQTARIAAGQSGLGAAMVGWHAAAMSMAGSVVRNSTYATTHTTCNLTYTSVAANCPTPTGQSLGTITDSSSPPKPSLFVDKSGKTECVPVVGVCTANDGNGNCTACAAQYDTTDYQFYSVLYHAPTPGGGTATDYVVTYVPSATISASNPAPGFVTLAKGNMISFTLDDLALQLGQTGLPAYAYGTVKTGTTYNTLSAAGPLYSGGTGGVYGGTYNVPTSVPAGSLAIVAAPDGL